MKIRSKFQLNTIFHLGLVIGIGVILFLTSEHVRETVQKNNAMNQVSHKVFEFNLLTSDYLLHQENRSYRQWHIIYDSLHQLLANQKFSSLEEQELIKEMQQNRHLFQKPKDKKKTIVPILGIARSTNQPNDHSFTSHAFQCKTIV